MVMQRQRQRMFLFERAYRDYGSRLTGIFRWCLGACAHTWQWFWEGKGAAAMELFLRLCVILAGVAMGVLYVMYERERGRGFTAGTLFAFLLITVVASVLMWGWKTPIHILARLTTGAAAAAAILLFTAASFLVVLTFFTAYLAALFAVTALSVIVFLPILAVEGVYRFVRGITYECQYDDCPSRDRWHNPLPVHVCDCGAEYSGLYPNFYGVFRHVCRHPNHEGGQKMLPTLDRLGRSSLQRRCAVCNRDLHPLAGWGRTCSVFVVGATSSGKTVLMIQLLRRLLRWVESVSKGQIMMTPVDKDWVRKSGDRLDAGTMPDATSGEIMQAKGAGVAVPGQIGKTSIFLYDAPGEHFLTMSHLAEKQGMGKARGIILLVDPLSSELYRKSPSHSPVSESLHTVGGNLVRVLRGIVATESNAPVSIPLAVVISKADQIKMPDGFGPLYNTNGHREDPEQLHQRCKGAVTKLEGPNAVNALEQNFSQIRYFACSALGGDGRQASDSRGVLEPLLWILGIEGDLHTASPIQNSAS